ncbi:hypothetical protein WJX79_000894 [Trebouxia sp. C0005]
MQHLEAQPGTTTWLVLGNLEHEPILQGLCRGNRLDVDGSGNCAQHIQARPAHPNVQAKSFRAHHSTRHVSCPVPRSQPGTEDGILNTYAEGILGKYTAEFADGSSAGDDRELADALQRVQEQLHSTQSTWSRQQVAAAAYSASQESAREGSIAKGAGVWLWPHLCAAVSPWSLPTLPMPDRLALPL